LSRKKAWQIPAKSVQMYYNKEVGESSQTMPEPSTEHSFQPMTKHYILSVDPTAQHDWERYTLRNPITGERPELAGLIAEAVGSETGSYLVAVQIEVTVLETAPLPQPERVPLHVPAVAATPHLKKLVAS
jgi:hypothetical protein